jgi:hypothetical protein
VERLAAPHALVNMRLPLARFRQSRYDGSPCGRERGIKKQ